ncbi:MAG: ATP-binding protein [Syntrophobacteraceae bacterium]
MSLSELKGPVILEIPADPASLFIVRALVGKISERIGFDVRESDKLVLAIDEACTNVIRYAYKNDSAGRLILTFTLSRSALEIQIRDFGSAADPSFFQSRDLNEIRPGGLGLHFIKSAMDKLEYECPPDGGMLLKMVKFRPKEEISKN